MSLKAVHIFFILTSIALFIFLTYYCYLNYEMTREFRHLGFAGGTFALTGGLLYYLFRVIQKFKSL